MASESLRFGIIGAANIAHKVAIALNDANNCCLVAVASRTQEKADAFAKLHNVPKAYSSYEELVDDEDVQAVYIPLPTGLRKEWVMKAAEKGKHVLSEKPFAVSSKDASDLVQFCKDKGVQLMDNTMFMHHARLPAMRAALDSGLVGQVTRVVSNFTLFMGKEGEELNIRCKPDMEPFGCLGDLGWYNLRFSLWAFDWEDPEAVSCMFHSTVAGSVPVDATATLKFSGGRSALFDCSFRHALRQSGEVIGTEGVLSLNDIVVTNRGDAEFKVTKSTIGDNAIFFPEEVLKHETFNCCQHQCLVEKFADIVKSGELDGSWPQLALQTQNLLSALVASAKKDGAWVRPPPIPTPRSAGTPDGRSLKVPTLAKVSDLDPEGPGLNLKLKVVGPAAAVEGRDDFTEAPVGDETGTIVFSAQGPEQAALLQEGETLLVRNGRITMVNGFMRLMVDKLGKVEASPEPLNVEVNMSDKTNKSATEFRAR